MIVSPAAKNLERVIRRYMKQVHGMVEGRRRVLCSVCLKCDRTFKRGVGEMIEHLLTHGVDVRALAGGKL